MRLIDEGEVIEALIEEGQRSKRYKLGETWELNLDEIRKAIATVPTAHTEPLTIKISSNISKDEIIDRIINELGKRKPSGIGYIRRKANAVD